MKNSFIISFLLLGQINFGQTATLTKVLGTKCSLIPPKGFAAATTFSGFQNSQTGASIIVAELPYSYKTVVDGYSVEEFRKWGMTFISKQEIDFKGYDATLYNVKQYAKGKTYIKFMLVFGDTSESVMVNGIFPESFSNEKAQKIKDALLTTVYDTTNNENPLELVPFTINTKDTEFKFVKHISKNLLYSTETKLSGKNPCFIVGLSSQKAPLENLIKYSEELLKKHMQGELFTIKEINELTIDNEKGYEIVATGKANTVETGLIYQVVLFTQDNKYFQFVGQSQNEFDKYLESFKKIVKTFKRK